MYNPFGDLKSPYPSKQTIKLCESEGDFRRVLFEYYKFTGQLVVISACLLHESPAWQGRTRKVWEICAASLDRIRRLMSANLEFFQDDRYIEASYIIDRCIFETATVVSWIALDRSDERVRRFLEGSLRNEQEHFRNIKRNVDQRGGKKLVIEERMIARIENFGRLAEIDLESPEKLRRLPDVSAMLRDIGQDRNVYVAAMKIGSHAVHGNWQYLVERHLEEQDGTLNLRFKPASSNPTQYALTPNFVLNCCTDYVLNCFDDDGFHEAFEGLVRDTQREIMYWHAKHIGDDFDFHASD